LAKNKLNPEQRLWFPKFYSIDKWENILTDKGITIISKCKDSAEREFYFEMDIGEYTDRVVFGHLIDGSGERSYKFLGVFKTDKKNSSAEGGTVFRRISNQVEILEK
jgi:hypothetical protein